VRNERAEQPFSLPAEAAHCLYFFKGPVIVYLDNYFYILSRANTEAEVCGLYCFSRQHANDHERFCYTTANKNVNEKEGTKQV